MSEQSTARTIEVFLVEDHGMMRDALVEFLGGFPGVSVCGTAESAAEALERLGELKPGLVLADVSLPGMSGIELVQEICRRWPDLPCLMLSGHHASSYVQRSRSAGARGYLLKGNPDELQPAIEQIANGGTYFSVE
ncbi:MAG: response regulator transcription factor [Pseudomonadales bacterium]